MEQTNGKHKHGFCELNRRLTSKTCPLSAHAATLCRPSKSQNFPPKKNTSCFKDANTNKPAAGAAWAACRDQFWKRKTPEEMKTSVVDIGWSGDGLFRYENKFFGPNKHQSIKLDDKKHKNDLSGFPMLKRSSMMTDHVAWIVPLNGQGNAINCIVKHSNISQLDSTGRFFKKAIRKPPQPIPHDDECRKRWSIVYFQNIPSWRTTGALSFDPSASA